jgi:penicillin-binding protein 1C
MNGRRSRVIEQCTAARGHHRGGAARLACGVAVGLILLGGVAIMSVLGTRGAPPDFAAVRAAWTPSYAYLLDRDGEVIEADRVDFDRLRASWVRIGDVSPALRASVIAVEDRRFERHRGIDWRSILAAAWQSLTGPGRRGGSTITMQLAGMTAADNAAAGGRSIAQKLRQMRDARLIERGWSKDQILEAYLNRVTFRGELEGIDAAAQALFGKAPSGLDAAESLVLASLIASPNSPAARVAERACALAAQRSSGVSCADVQYAALALGQRRSRIAVPTLAAHVAHGLLTAPGQRVRTTLSAPLQQLAADVLARQLGALGQHNVRDGAAVVIDNAAGEVLAYVGSAGSASSAAAVDGADAPRQAGSTLKPFLYGLAFERRYLTTVSVLDDSPLNLETSSGLYVPQNYDREFVGLVSARTALASSLNVPAVRTLILVGVEPFRDRLYELGYAGIDRDGAYYGYSLALGSAEVTLLQQANAYRTLANAGLWSPLRLTLDDGSRSAGRRVMSPEAAFLVSDILSDAAARSRTFGLDSVLATPFWTAVKTGTSKDMRDNWCIGYSDRYTVAVWVGNFEGDSMLDVSGVSGAAPAWHELMLALHRDRPSRAPAAPTALVARRVAFAPAIESPRDAWFLRGTEVSRVEVLQRNAATARITSPANGAIIALDPDIPAANQRVVLQTRGGAADLEYYLNGRSLGSSDRPRRWLPQPGAHRLEIRSADGRVRDSIRFVVRGAS